MKVKKICQQCGKEYHVPHWDANRKYCSRECSNEAQMKPYKHLLNDERR